MLIRLINQIILQKKRRKNKQQKLFSGDKQLKVDVQSECALWR